MKAKRVFISYSSFDRQHAFEIFRLLEQHDSEVWLDFFDIKPAEQLSRELKDNVANADLVCLLLSPASVQSKWVTHEVEIAQGAGVRVLPVILRPCRIPDLLDDLVGIDLSGGLADEAVRIRFLDAVSDRTRDDDALLLSAGQRSELAKQEAREQADRDLPDAAEQLARIIDEPIREVSVELDSRTFPSEQPTILELRLTLDRLWTVPMSFFFAPYHEGATWPQQLGFHEPPYTEYTQARRPRVDCKFRWFDHVEELTTSLDSTDFEYCNASFSLEFDGGQFRPAGPDPHVPQTFEIPSLRKLCDKKSHFELVAHYPEIRTAEVIDLATSDVDIQVRARFKGEPPGCRLFHSRHEPAEQNLLCAEGLAQIENLIEREALLGLLPKSAPSSERKRSILEALAEDREIAPEDVRFAARLCFGNAQLASIRGQHQGALMGYQKVSLLLEPVVLGGYPTYDEGVLMYRSCANLVGYFMQRENYERAQDFVNGVGLVAQRLVELDSAEPEYVRLWADALLRNAIVHAENGNTAQATSELRESVGSRVRLYRELLSRERLIDAKDAVAQALEYASRWEIEAELPLEDWRREFDPDGAISGALKAADAKRRGGPVWLQACELEKWPTVPYESPLLRYALRVPQHYSKEPELTSTVRETAHIFRGPWPTEWLIVSFMDKAEHGGRMNLWVDAVLSMVGFPVLELTSQDGPPPQLIEWIEEPSLDVIAVRLDADEAYGYTGVAKLSSDEPRLTRIYILLVRRGTLAWKITVAFETACLPGMPPAMVDSNDHVRAGAILGTLKLG